MVRVLSGKSLNASEISDSLVFVEKYLLKDYKVVSRKSIVFPKGTKT
jgi:hypothetical protein